MPDLSRRVTAYPGPSGVITESWLSCASWRRLERPQSQYWRGFPAILRAFADYYSVVTIVYELFREEETRFEL